MSKRDVVKLQEIATELNNLSLGIEKLLGSSDEFSGHNTLVVSQAVEALTIFSTNTANMARAVTMMDIPDCIKKPAYVALAFRMAMIRKHQPDASLHPTRFDKMTLDMIGELHFLQEFILMTFNQEIDFHAHVEMSSHCTGLVDTLLLTTFDTGNTYRTKVSGCSHALRSHMYNFDLFDGVKYGSVLVSV